MRFPFATNAPAEVMLVAARRTRVYADTSVFGGAFDDEFRDTSRRFFEQTREGEPQLVTSAVVEQELRHSPPAVRRFFHDVLSWAEVVEVSPDAVRLQTAYIEAGVVSPGAALDALHVALATTSGCRVIVSWNFRHIVHFAKIALYNAVNTLQGHREIAIHAPGEVIAYEDEDL